MKRLTVPERHQLRIARDTLRHPLKGKILGGMTVEEAREVVRQLTGREPRRIEPENERGHHHEDDA